MDNKNQPNDNSSQNELDLGFNHSDSVTPRKTIQQSGSIFDKAKGLFGKKQQARYAISCSSRANFWCGQQANLFRLLKHSKVKMLEQVSSSKCLQLSGAC